MKKSRAYLFLIILFLSCFSYGKLNHKKHSDFTVQVPKSLLKFHQSQTVEGTFVIYLCLIQQIDKNFWLIYEKALIGNFSYQVKDGIHLIEERHLHSGQLIAKYHYENAMSNCPLYVERDTDNNGTLDQKLIVITDDRGTVVGLADESGNVVERAFYNSTGLIKGFDASGNPCKNKYGKETYRCSIPFGYTGYHHDPFTGKYHTLLRDYDAVTTRWLSEDPKGYIDGMGLYASHMGINFTDIDGGGVL